MYISKGMYVRTSMYSKSMLLISIAHWIINHYRRTSEHIPLWAGVEWAYRFPCVSYMMIKR